MPRGHAEVCLPQFIWFVCSEDPDCPGWGQGHGGLALSNPPAVRSIHCNHKHSHSLRCPGCGYRLALFSPTTTPINQSASSCLISPLGLREVSLRLSNCVWLMFPPCVAAEGAQPVATVAPSVLNVQQGQRAEFRCTVTGKPTPAIEWIGTAS